MQLLIYLFFLGYILFPNPIINDSNNVKVKIELAKLSEINELVSLGIKADGYIIEKKYWITTLSYEEIDKLNASGFQYIPMTEVLSKGVEKYVSYLLGDIKTIFNNCGYQLTVSYNQSEKLSFMCIQVFDLRGNRLDRKIGYNVPPSNYECKFSSYNWSDGIYLVQIETNKKESIHKIFQKNFISKKI